MAERGPSGSLWKPTDSREREGSDETWGTIELPSGWFVTNDVGN